ncbi:G0/G1 switch protein 2 [Latimeria chalumnae]|uniref:G0/G1 switch 2 n=1 Tax=Latimeria chalumnae TaxID=7897 RepID=H3BH24_LATCH|nr:PREDICTED: G0/G1 switch protein 2 [Latimeria chalumnae]|eukprot:XP_005987723.1 PREDICTED: G0/G1 switch protein 2 [Latimeria chalumnae]
METLQELIPFAKEMLSQKPNRKMVKIYVIGSVLAFFGVLIGLVEAVCHPFTSEKMLKEEVKSPSAESQKPEKNKDEEMVLEKKKQQSMAVRSTANRLHAS